MVLIRPSSIATLAFGVLAIVCSTEAGVLKKLSPKLLSGRTSPIDLSKFQVPLSNALAFSILAGYQTSLPEPHSSMTLDELTHNGNERSPKRQRSLTFPSPGSATLPSPAPGLSLKAITLGRGTQNYTCAAGSTAAPVAVGAKADLLDVTPFLPPRISPAQSLHFLNLITQYLVSFDVATIEKSKVPKLGSHIFDATGVPVFDLGPKGLLRAKKLAGIAAPPKACKGANGHGFGAVDWLALTDVPGSVGLKEVYRVETAGGKAPPSCGGGDAHAIAVPYAAQYWFFGPS
ncbi:MAG: hypothetical protein Q9185_002858 [Variospora sp. 1 TL-2023]